MTGSSDPRTRRSSAEVRSLVLRAARELFESRGYAAVSTRDIAAHAGVTQALVFRHFGTKADLFVDAVYLPFSDFVAEYVTRWGDRDDATTAADDTRRFVSGLYAILLANRRLLVTLTSEFGPDSPDASRPRGALLQNLLERLEAEVVRRIQARGATTMDPAHAVRLTFGLVYGVALLGDDLFPHADGPSRGSIVDSMAGFVLRGAQLPSDEAAR